MLKELEKRFHEEIPMTKMMGLKLESLNDKELISTIPINININDKGSAFGGSSNSLAIISGWFVCTIIAKKLNLDNTMIAIIKNNTSFKAPITKNLICHTFLPNEEEIKKIESKIKEKASASIKLNAQIIEDGKVCLEFEGLYVIKLKWSIYEKDYFITYFETFII